MVEITKALSYRGIIRGNIVMFPANEALDIIAICRKQKIKILGIDAFRITEHSTQPLMDNSINLSQENYSKLDCWNEARKLIERLQNNNLYFEIVTEDHEFEDRKNAAEWK